MRDGGIALAAGQGGIGRIEDRLRRVEQPPLHEGVQRPAALLVRRRRFPLGPFSRPAFEGLRADVRDKARPSAFGEIELAGREQQ